MSTRDYESAGSSLGDRPSEDKEYDFKRKELERLKNWEKRAIAKDCFDVIGRSNFPIFRAFFNEKKWNGFLRMPRRGQAVAAASRHASACGQFRYRERFVVAIDFCVELFKIYDRFDVNYVDETGLSHFHLACVSPKCRDVVRKFLELGQDPNLVWPLTADRPLHFGSGDNSGVSIESCVGLLCT
ncbi:hypothetical protein TKK_0004680 [Trichogramma kaykai]